MLIKQTNKRATGGTTEQCQQVWGKKWGITGIVKWKDMNPVWLTAKKSSTLSIETHELDVLKHYCILCSLRALKLGKLDAETE